MNTYRTMFLVALVIAGTTAGRAHAQYMQQPKKLPTYSSYLNRHGPKYERGNNLNRYIYDKYYYRSPSVSPYQNIYRPDTADGSTAYYRWVLPERKRRAGQSAQQKFAKQKQPDRSWIPPQFGTGYSTTSSHLPRNSSYHNQWYGKSKYRR